LSVRLTSGIDDEIEFPKIDTSTYFDQLAVVGIRLALQLTDSHLNWRVGGRLTAGQRRLCETQITGER